MSNNVNSRSTKAEIIEASAEVIGTLENKLEVEERLKTIRKEERDSVIYLLIASSVYSVLF